MTNLGTRRISRNSLFSSADQQEEGKINLSKGFKNKQCSSNLNLNDQNLFTPSQATRNINNRYGSTEQTPLKTHEKSSKIPNIHQKNNYDSELINNINHLMKENSNKNSKRLLFRGFRPNEEKYKAKAECEG